MKLGRQVQGSKDLLCDTKLGGAGEEIKEKISFKKIRGVFTEIAKFFWKIRDFVF